MSTTPPSGFERPSHIPPPRLPEPDPRVASLGGERWREPLLAGAGTFLVGNALGFIVAGLVAPADFMVAADHPGRPAMMDLWVMFGMPLVGLVAATTTALRARRTSAGEWSMGAIVAASSAPFVLAVGLIFALYPGSRSQQLEIASEQRQQFEVRERSVNVSAATLEGWIVQYKDTPYLDEALYWVERGTVINGSEPLPAGAIREVRALLAQGKLKLCTECPAALEAKELWNGMKPNLVGWSLDHCSNAECRDFLARMLMRRPMRYADAGACAPLPQQQKLFFADYQALVALTDAGPTRRSAATGAALRPWLALQQQHCGAGTL